MKYFPLGRIIHYSISFDHRLKHISHVIYNLIRDQMISSPQYGVYTEYTHGKYFDLWVNWEIHVSVSYYCGRDLLQTTVSPCN